jgi:putative membrane protein
MSGMNGLFLGLAIAVTAGACAGGSGAGSEPLDAKLTDAEIAAVVVAANEIDAEIGDLAVARSSNAEVQAFGRSMAVDHRAINRAAGELLARLGVTPVENTISRSLRSDAVKTKEALGARTGHDFDAAYLAHEVAYHGAVIDAVDQLLVPAATNAELKATLIAVRPALVAHLRHAEQLQGSLHSVVP